MQYPLFLSRSGLDYVFQRLGQRVSIALKTSMERILDSVRR
jgi:hypothetical protein